MLHNIKQLGEGRFSNPQHKVRVHVPSQTGSGGALENVSRPGKSYVGVAW